MKDDYTTNSQYLSRIFLALKGWENVLFELGIDRVNTSCVFSWTRDDLPTDQEFQVLRGERCCGYL